MARIMALDLALSIAMSTWLFFFSSAELQRLGHPIKGDGSLSFLAVGDWGRNGTFNQSQVAYQMGKIGEELDVDFMVSLGDNFYENGLKDVHDKFFEDSFTNIYTAKSLQKQWYAILGNHDYRGDVLAQLDPLLQNIDSRWLCKRSFIVNSEVAELFFVDTSPFVMKYWNSKSNKYDWRGVAPRKNYIKMLLEDLDLALAESTAAWKIVLGHHTMRSVSDHGDTVELVEKLLPILESNGVDLYINGHDHCLEHISSTNSPIQFITSGGGSKAWRGVFNPTTAGKLQFFYDGQGFISLQLTKTDAKIVYYDVSGTILYQWSTSKQSNFFM